MEILVVDGGSTDGTLKIAKKYNCRILKNPKVLPAWAKFIAYREARGTFLMYLDSDEVMVNEDSIEKKIKVLQENPDVRAVTGSGYINPRGFGFLNQYINEFGDPFSFFYYRLSKDHRFFVPTMKRRYAVVKETDRYLCFDFSNARTLPIFELVAMGSVVDASFLKQHFPVILKKPQLVPHFFNLLISKGSRIAIVQNDPLVHYSANTIRGFLNKITSRVISNVFTAAKEGFRGRSEFDRESKQYKTFFFLPYSLSILFPFFDSLYLALSRKSIWYISHVFLSFYTAVLIVYYTTLKLFGVKLAPVSYGGNKPI
jgi:glycosyltransferase involved in cell wall biosynthesis